MTIEAKVIADSISPAGIRLTTFQLRYPRFIHAELMTHRVFSRNASSSRAIPVKKMIEDLRRDPAMPVYWGTNKPGMQAGEELSDEGGALTSAKSLWLDARDYAIGCAETMIELGLHKQIANRILEPWAHINVVVTATDWANFFKLRCHRDAQPELKALAELMAEELINSEPNSLKPGEWHLPYLIAGDRTDIRISVNDDREQALELFKKVSVARCARVSYLTHDGRQTTIEEDLALFDRLVGSQPLHASPSEHQATPDELENIQTGLEREDGSFDTYEDEAWCHPELHGNFRGWIQYRKTLPGEFVPG